MTTSHHIICIGSVLWDIIGRTEHTMRIGSDVPGQIQRIPGGVAMNIAMTVVRFGMTPTLLTAVGKDDPGHELLTRARQMGMVVDHVHHSDTLPTDMYMAIEDGSGVIAAIADAHSLEQAGASILTPLFDGRLGSVEAPYDGVIALDGNLTAELLSSICHSPAFAKSDLRVAPASPGKAERLLELIGHPNATFYVNLEEAGLLCNTTFDDATTAAKALHDNGVARALVTNGSAAAALCDSSGVVAMSPPPVQLARATGAGDTFMAAHIAAERSGETRAAALESALDTAARYVSGEDPA